jgi:hypothetical protein
LIKSQCWLLKFSQNDIKSIQMPSLFWWFHLVHPWSPTWSLNYTLATSSLYTRSQSQSLDPPIWSSFNPPGKKMKFHIQHILRYCTPEPYPEKS